MNLGSAAGAELCQIASAYFSNTIRRIGADWVSCRGTHFGQLFSTHGTIMVFFMAMPFLIGP
jgi:cytochrome o ubiquinol oxidase subunit 1